MINFIMGKHITIILEDNLKKKLCEKQAKPNQILIGSDVYQTTSKFTDRLSSDSLEERGMET
jgi:hypothetical protein